uniref:Copper chaperone CopZ n=1 Tax=Candidatus Kentrum sp. MB TaxID=2138164 RepID=A0A451B9H3_9GAMM|nr:MAG: Copper chaperone CopZ [Candidatus Kentron sp. MB]VFK27039.1 MAG: Copper chaperone CopZ [Candidatus Kentron sp. MB]VFK74925.1 MAG: Copper chaperone CopZ [Candidatus Kentron sp. MB]
MQYTIEVDNIKCHGCANTIRKKTMAAHNVEDVTVNVEAGAVTITSSDDQREAIGETLHSLGYPQRGSAEGFDQIKAKATSFVSCVIGRMDR